MARSLPTWFSPSMVTAVFEISILEPADADAIRRKGVSAATRPPPFLSIAA
nr:hypothetical protein [Sinorhizobium meliloti]